jgi:septum formation protein
MIAPIDPWILVLGSTSPRRAELLTQIGWPPLVLKPTFEEKPLPDEPPQDYVMRNALGKAQSLIQGYDWKKSNSYLLLSADTVVFLKGEILEKPRDKEDARAMLTALSGQTHLVLTGWTLSGIRDGKVFARVEELVTTEVTFRPLNPKEIAIYCDTPEPYDKSGSYGIQGPGCHMIQKVKGSITSVMGLPLAEVVLGISRMVELR